MNVNIIELFLKSGILVQSVMILLLIFSVMSWAIILQKNKALTLAQKQMKTFDTLFWKTPELDMLYDTYSKKKNELGGTERIFHSGFKEFYRLHKISPEIPKVALDGASRAMRLSMNRELDMLETHIPFLGMVGSVSPYIGLFGTVWGIMRAFIALGSAKQATLQMVAPGIAEALVTTAIGLFAAIPAVMAYNRLTVRMNRLDQEYLNFIDEFISILQRQVVAVRK